tara:strand:+ start:2627 stop:3022 length:396 start_codon:yes stop_codon:yes gene_type:complete
MTTELIAMLGGGASGFIFKLIGQLVSNQAAVTNAMIKKQKAADESHQKASTRGGEWVRRVIVCTVLFAVVVAPFLLAHSPEGVTVGQETSKFFGLFKGIEYQTLNGYLILPEIRQTVLAIVGFYFGSSTIK